MKFRSVLKLPVTVSIASTLWCVTAVLAHAQDGLKEQEEQDNETGFGTQDIPDDESLNTTDTPFPFFSHFVFGAGSGQVPLVSYEKESGSQSLYHLNLGIDVPFFVDLNYAIAVGARVFVQYPTYLNIKDGEPTYHMAFAPNIEIYRNILRDQAWDIDVYGGLTWNFRRSQYAAGTLASNGPEIMVGTKVRWLPYTILDSTPIVNVRAQLFGPLNSFKMSSTANDSNNVEFTPDDVFRSNGDVTGTSFEISTGLSAPSSVAQTENEFLFGYFHKAAKYASLRADTKRDVSSTYSAFFIAWRRTWVK